MSTAHFRQHFQRKLLPILRIDREFSERRRNGFLFPRPWGRWWGRIGGFFVPTCANSCELLLTRAIPPNRWKQRKSPGTSTKFRDYLWRWGESNPRPTADPEVFSERSLRVISQPLASCRPATREAQLIKCRSRPTNTNGTQWLPKRRQTPDRKQLPG